MAELGIVITARNLAQQALGQVEGQLGAINRQAGFASRGMSGLQGVVGTGLKVAAGIGVAAMGAVAGAIGAGTLAFAGFQQGMNEVFTLMPGISQSAMDQMSSDVKKFSTEFKTLPETVVPALYQALSAGVPPDNVFSFLEVAQKAAVAGVTDLTTAVDGITSVVNAYGEEVIGAGRASDIMFTTVKLGKTNFEQLSSSLFNVIPAAASLGVSFEDIGAAMARMTAQGTPTSVATTQLRSLLVEAAKDGTKLADAIQAVAGDSFPNLIAQGQNVGQILETVRSSMPDNEFRNLFGSVEAAAAALGITGPQYEAFVDTLEEMKNAAGATDAAFAQMDTGINRLKEGITAFAAVALLEIGQRVSPYLEQIAGQFADALPAAMELFTAALDTAVTTIDGFIASADDIQASIEQVLATVGAVIEPITSVIGAFVAWQDVLMALGIVVASIVLPALKAMALAAAPVILMAVALIAGIALLRNAWENDWGGIQTKTMEVLATIGPLLDEARAWLEEKIPQGLAILQATWDTVWPVLQATFDAAWAAISTGLTTAAEWLETTIPDALVTLNLAWSAVWQVLSAVFLSVWEGIQTGLTAAKDWFDATLPDALTTLQTAWDTAWTAMQTAWDTLHTALSTGIETIMGWFSSDMPGALTTLQETWTTVTATIQTVWDALVAFLMPTIQKIIEAFPLMIESFAPVGPKIQELWDVAGPVIMKLNAFIGVLLVIAVKAFGEVIAAVMPHVGTVIATVLDAIILGFTAADTALTALLTAFQTNWPAIQTAVETAWTNIKENLEAVRIFFVTTLPTALTLLHTEFQVGWAAIQGFVTGAIDNIVSTFKTLQTWLTTTLRTAFNGFKTFLNSFSIPNPFDVIRAALDAIPAAIETMKTKMNEIKAFMSGLVIRNPFAGIQAPSIPSWVPGFGGNAAGSGFFRGGLTMVGERGPELVMLPRGSRIESSERTERMMGGEGVTINNYFTVADNLDMEAAAYKIARRIQERGR